MSSNILTKKEFVFTKNDFHDLKKIASEYTGIVVSDEKFDMYYARLAKRLRILGLISFRDYIEYLHKNWDNEFSIFIDSITTNLTSFFREKHHFDYIMDKHIPEMMSRNVTKFNIWSAGCSTGEEAYSIAITLSNLSGIYKGLDYKILASDIDTSVLAKAESGIYEIERVSSLNSNVLKRWFLRGKGGNAGKARVVDELKNRIMFRNINLIQEWPSFNGKFDIIFCRNVIIYFDKDTKTMLINKFAHCLKDGGLLILGHSESLHGLSEQYKVIGKTIYRKT